MELIYKLNTDEHFQLKIYMTYVLFCKIHETYIIIYKYKYIYYVFQT
jgi:hypothetical protein